MDNPVRSALTMLDRSIWTVRDIRVLDAIRQQGGMSGADIFAKLGLKYRSMVKNSIVKLERAGLITDTRERKERAMPCHCYITEQGIFFLEEMGL